MTIQLSEEESLSIGRLIAKYSERAKYSITLELLLDKWRNFVQLVESGYDDSIYEYMNDLSSRTILQEIIEELDETVGPKIAHELQPWDERFTHVSVSSARPMEANKAIEEYPWLFRVPKDMDPELRDDLLLEGFIRS